MKQHQGDPKPPLDLLAEIGFLPEWLIDEIEDPLSTLSPGQAARMGAALSALGALLSDNAKNAVFGWKNHQDQGVIFNTIDATSYPAVATAKVKSRFPISQYPELYKKNSRKAHVTAELPFDIKKLRQAA